MLLILIDRSYSMSATIGGWHRAAEAVSRLEASTRSLVSHLKELSLPQEVAIISFNEYATFLVSATLDKLRNIEDALETLHPYGGTDLASPLILAKNLIDNGKISKPTRILFLSDGEGNLTEMREALAYFIRHRIPIDFGSFEESEFQRAASEFLDRTGGASKSIGDFADMDDFIQTSSARAAKGDAWPAASPNELKRDSAEADQEILPENVLLVDGENISGYNTGYADIVDCSVFSPESVSRGSELMVQVFLHLCIERSAASQRASTYDKHASIRGTQTLMARICRESRIDLYLRSKGVKIDAKRQTIVWRGEFTSCNFLIKVPIDYEQENLHAVLQILDEGMPIGRILFKVAIADKEVSESSSLKGSARTYRNAFCSYSSKDSKTVLRIVQALSRVHIDCFFDKLAIEPGDLFKFHIFSEIEHREAFLLFWSSNSRESRWVKMEIDWAVKHQSKNDRKLPDIVPIVIEGPPPPPPPEGFEDVHFDDYYQYMISGFEKGALIMSKYTEDDQISPDFI